VFVPQAAQGFTLLSADIEMVDLGTEFGVEVAPRRETQVHVFDGKVELYPPDTQRAAENRIELLAGSGRRIERSGKSSPITADPQAFVTTRELKQRVDQDMALRAGLWARHLPFGTGGDEQGIGLYLGFAARMGSVANWPMDSCGCCC